MQTPTISVILPNFNGAKYLQSAIKSFLAQEYSAKELVIVDGVSTDSSHAIIKAVVHTSIRWVQEKDVGISDAFNKGFSTCSGDIIGYLGSDDVLAPGLFQRIAALRALCPFDAVYFNSYTNLVAENKCTLQKPLDVPFDRSHLLRHGTLVGWQNIYFARHVYEKHKMDTGVRSCMDYEFYLRISNEPYLYLYADEVATLNRFDGNISTDADGKQFKEACAVAKRYARKGDSVYFKPRPYLSYWRSLRPRLGALKRQII